MTDYQALTLGIGVFYSSDASVVGTIDGLASATTITGGWWLTKTTDDDGANPVWGLNVDLEVEWDVNWTSKGSGNPERVDVTWGILPIEDVIINADGNITEIFGTWEQLTVGATNEDDTLTFGKLTLGENTYSDTEDLEAKLTNGSTVAGWSITESGQLDNIVVSNKDYLTGMTLEATRPLVPDEVAVSDLTIETGSYLLCVAVVITQNGDTIRDVQGCEIMDISTSCLNSYSLAGLKEGICDVVGTGAGMSSDGYALPVPVAVSESGASTLLYGAAMALVTAQLAF